MENYNENFDRLVEIIEKEIEFNTQLRELLIEEQKILMSKDVTVVEGNIKEQDYIIGDIKKLEEIRIEYVDKISKNSNIAHKNITFKDIIEIADDKYSDKLKMLADELKSVVNDIVKINDSNKYLINNGLEFIEENIKVFYNANDKEMFYKKGGNKKDKKGNNFRIVDRKV